MNEGIQDRSVVLVVVLVLGLVAVLGQGGIIWLVYLGVEPNAIAIVVGMPTAAVGALAGILAMTRTGTQQAEQRGAEKALAQVQQLADSPPPEPPPAAAGAPSATPPPLLPPESGL